MPAAIHVNTPMLSTVDARGRVVREVNYHRSAPATLVQRHVEQNCFDVIGHCVAQRDPRLWALFEEDPHMPANLSRVYSLSGRELSRDSVDAGFSCTLFGEAGQPVLAHDGKGHQCELEYDELLRPLALFEQGPEQPRTASERYVHADADPDHAPFNACGRRLRTDDPAGSMRLSGYSLSGDVSVEIRRFLSTPEWPDWPLNLDERDALLEPGQAVTHWQHGPLGQVLAQTDASAHRRFVSETVAGQLYGVRLQLAEGHIQTVLDSVRYDALNQIDEERLGDVTVRREYGREDGRMTRLIALRASDGALQDLHYRYDPVGNVLSIEDKARSLVHFANQRVEPLCEYAYDSLYQLIESRGWEAGASTHGPGSRLDPGAVSNYRQTYRYDAAGNLLELVHHGAQAHGRVLQADKHSNRCLPVGADFTEGFDANGNLRYLARGHTLHWGLRNQLREVAFVTRSDSADDRERNVYDGAGQRVRKLGSREVASRTHSREVRYLPGLERHDDSGSRERFEVITLEVGTCSLRVLRWQQGKPADLPQDQFRYALGDHLGSVSLELDGNAALISHEVFHPFGTTAWWAGRDEVEASYKTVRYSGKERDATGLYYYGARYYAPWLQRWLNPDPAGEVDGLNLYCMVGNAPINRRDPQGKQEEHVIDDVEAKLILRGDRIIHHGLKSFPRELRSKISDATHLAREMADSARIALKGGRGQRRLTKVMTSAFGADGLAPGPALDHLKGKLSRKFKRSARFLRSLKKEGWKLLLVDYADPERAASAFSSSIRSARISLSSQEVRLGVTELATTLLHESLHAMDMEPGTQASADDVLDFWYAVPTVVDGGGTLSGMEHVMRRAFRRVARRGPDEAEMDSYERGWYARLVNARTAQLGLPEARNAAERRRYFREQPLVRHKVGTNNADTLTGIAFALRKRRHN